MFYKLFKIYRNNECGSMTQEIMNWWNKLKQAERNKIMENHRFSRPCDGIEEAYLREWRE